MLRLIGMAYQRFGQHGGDIGPTLAVFYAKPQQFDHVAPTSPSNDMTRQWILAEYGLGLSRRPIELDANGRLHPLLLVPNIPARCVSVEPRLPCGFLATG
jgi:hypothetical protein